MRCTGTDTTLVVTVGVRYVCADIQPFGHIYIQRRAEVVTGVLGRIDDTHLVRITARKEVINSVRASAYVQLVVLRRTGMIGLVPWNRSNICDESRSEGTY